MSKKKNIKNEKEKPVDATVHGKGEQNEANPTDNGQPKAEEKEQDTKQEIDPIEDLQKQLEESKEKYIRLSAEFDNYRKRTQREKMDLIRFGSEDAMKGILPLVDDFERAIKSSEGTTDIEAIKKGLTLIHGKFIEFLKVNNVQEIEAVGQELDTDLHEAITKIPTDDESLKGRIVDVVEKGYKLNDKVIRYAKVVIGE